MELEKLYCQTSKKKEQVTMASKGQACFLTQAHNRGDFRPPKWRLILIRKFKGSSIWQLNGDQVASGLFKQAYFDQSTGSCARL